MSIIYVLSARMPLFGIEHFAPIIITAIIGFFLIKWGQRLDSEKARRLGFAIATIPAITVIFRVVTLLSLGEFDITKDLPLAMCNFAAISAPIMMWLKSRVMFGVLYFWICIGTFAANILPDLPFRFPDFRYFTFWTLHSVLVLVPLYAIFVHKMKVYRKDILRTWLVTTCFQLMTYSINVALNSNYFYTMEKPPTGGLLDFLGEHPQYMFTGNLMVLGLICLFYLPFGFSKRKGEA